MILYKYTHRHNTLPMCSFTQVSKSVVWCFMPSQLLQLHLGDGSHKPCSQSSGAVWKSRWPSWAPVPNKPTVSVDVKQHFNNNKPCQQRTVHRCLCYVKPAATRAAPPCRILIADMCMKAALPTQNYNSNTMDEWRWGHSCMSLEVLAVQCRPKRCNSISVWMFCLDVHALTIG